MPPQVLLFLLQALVPVPLGLPVTVDYHLPQGYRAEPVRATEAYSVLDQAGGRVTLVPLALDTLHLLDLKAFLDDDTLVVPGPVLLVEPLIPDPLPAPASPPAPAPMNIPPGLPIDYLLQRAFWLSWAAPPGPGPLPYIAGAALLAGITLFLILRRRKKPRASPAEERETKPSARQDVMALLESRYFVHGEWKKLFAEIEVMLRALVARRFGEGNPALTLLQLERTLARKPEGREFLKQAAPLMREITLQIYANRGSTRERSRGFILILAELTGGKR